MNVHRVREMELRYKPIRLPLPVQGEVRSPRDAARVAFQLLADSVVEKAIALHLNTRRHLIGVHTISIGTIDAAIIQPRDVLAAALMSQAASIVIAHNHPSGDPTPSPDDRAVCERLVSAGQLMGIPIDDFLVIGEGWRYCSFREIGVLS